MSQKTTQAAIDGPIPIGDIAGIVGAAAITGCAIAQGISNANYISSMSKSVALEKEKIISAPTTNFEPTYYHVTTYDNAGLIMASGKMIGSVWEGGYVYAWGKYPNSYAIENSGAKSGVIISFTTSSPFVPDPGIDDPKVNIFYPLVSLTPGPISVHNIHIIGETK